MEKPSPPPQPPPSSIFRHLINFDTSVSLTLYNLTQPILPRPFLKLLEISGDGRLFFPILLSLLLSPLRSDSPLLLTLLVNLLIGSLLDLLLIGLIKHLVRRPRPVYNKHMFLTFAVDHWSFPSGHASRVCFTASLIYLTSDLIPSILLQLKSRMSGFDEFENVKRVNTVVIAWATATSVSRVLLGRHFVFDVAAGAGLGILNASIVFHFLNCCTTANALNHFDATCRQKEFEKEIKNYNWRDEDDRSAFSNLSPHRNVAPFHYI